MYRIFYVSSVSPFFSENMVIDLCSKAEIYNREVGIGGALLYNGKNFAQVLEGERTIVRSLFEKIGKDIRHSNLIVMKEVEAKERYFKEWGMSLSDGFDFSMLHDAMDA
ncbi:MAG: BLUF domain-containing protein [Pseudomonadota bacterium]